MADKLSSSMVKMLILAAQKARENAYAPYSHFTVGAALLTKSGKIYKGCNIENCAFTPTSCAERTAFFSAICDGEREFSAIAVVGGDEGKLPLSHCMPCGVCRQVMREFCDDGFFIISAISEEDYESLTLTDLLPHSFSPADLSK